MSPRWAAKVIAPAGVALVGLVLAACSPSEPADPPETAITGRWTEFITAAASRSDQAQLAELASAEVVQLADRVFFEPRLPQTFFTQVTIGVDGATATIEDCSLFSFPLVDFPYIPMTGQATRSDGTWLITQLEVKAEDRCLPGDLANEVLGAYERFWDAELAFSDPPDPNHGLIETTLTGRRLERKRALLDWQVENTAVLRGRPATNPEITEFMGTSVVVSDCQTTDPETGFYDQLTGERRPELPPPEPGQTDFVRTTLELDGTRWKVEFSGADSNVDCVPFSAEDTIHVVGPLENDP